MMIVQLFTLRIAQEELLYFIKKNTMISLHIVIGNIKNSISFNSTYFIQYHFGIILTVYFFINIGGKAIPF